MPLFTFISGFIFSMHSSKVTRLGKLLRSKARRLLLPLVVVGVPISLLQALAPGVNKDVSIGAALFSFVIPINHFWFLQAIFLVFCVVGVASVVGVFRRRSGTVLMLLLSSVLFLMPVETTEIFSVSRAIYLLPFFLTGMVAHQFSDSLKTPSRYLYLGLLLGLLILQMYLAAYSREVAIDRKSLTSLAVGFFSCLLLYGVQIKSRVLCVIGGYSFAIYLFHTVFAVAVRLAAGWVGMTNSNLLVLGELIAGILGPICVAIVVSKSHTLSTLILGERLSPGNSAEKTV